MPDSPQPRLLVLGANGPTGRRTVQYALDRGHPVVALTRHPTTFPLQHPRLTVIGGDATDAQTIDHAVREVDQVICVLGASFTLRPVEVYSTTTRLLVDSMLASGRRRLIVVTSGGVDPREHLDGGWGERASYTIMRRIVGRSVYDDMAQMEALVWGTDLDWTVVRPPGLTDTPAAGYEVAETNIAGKFCSHDDLATMLLDQLADPTYVRKIAAVCTPGLTVGVATMLRREVLKR